MLNALIISHCLLVHVHVSQWNVTLAGNVDDKVRVGILPLREMVLLVDEEERRKGEEEEEENSTVQLYSPSSWVLSR